LPSSDCQAISGTIHWNVSGCLFASTYPHTIFWAPQYTVY